MERLVRFCHWSLLVIVALPVCSVVAETKAKTPLPPVPITYAADTNETIIRRAQGIEGARNEGTFSWWTSLQPAQIQVLADEFNKLYPFIKVTYWRGQDKERDTRLEVVLAPDLTRDHEASSRINVNCQGM